MKIFVHITLFGVMIACAPIQETHNLHTIPTPAVQKSGYEVPTWATTDAQKRVGDYFYVVGHGEAPSIEIARDEAINSCKTTAANQVNIETKVKALSVETESNTAFHQEIRQEYKVTGLVCQPIKEKIFQHEDFFEIYLRCRFDLSKAKIVSTSSPDDSTNPTESLQKGIIDRSDFENKNTNTDFKSGSYSQSQTRQLTVATVPQCSSIIIQGSKPRSIKCDTNPMNILIEPQDTSLIFRADGFAPVTIKLHGGLPNDEAIQIIFD